MMRWLWTAGFIVVLLSTSRVYAQQGSREDPVPIGVPADVGAGWTITVEGVNPEEFIGAGGRPTPQERAVLARLAITYNGVDQRAFPTYLLHAVGPSGIAHAFFEPASGTLPRVCGAFPNPLAFWADVSPGSTLRGNVCWITTTENARNLLMYLDPSGDWPTQQHVYFRLTPTDVPSSRGS
jgi:hypothetical protein